eukprot:5210831-Amphidinium_carterae.1
MEVAACRLMERLREREMHPGLDGDPAISTADTAPRIGDAKGLQWSIPQFTQLFSTHLLAAN